LPVGAVIAVRAIKQKRSLEMTRSEIRSRIRKKLGETTQLFWTDAELNSWCEDAQKDIVWKAKLKRTRGTFTTVASTARYSLTTVIPTFMRVVDGGVSIYSLIQTKWTKLPYITKGELELLNPDWTDADAAAPQYYMEDLDENIIELWPAPIADNVGTNYCRIYYSATPTAMSSDAASPDLDAQGLLHPAIVDFVAATGFESRGYWDIANDVWSKYYEKIKSYMIEKNNKEDEEIVMRNYRNI
jgi:hypothetical protein